MALVSDDFDQVMRLAVNHSGDADSTGAIAGNLMGAMIGLEAIDDSWLKPLELKSAIEQMADDLLDFTYWPIGEDGLSEEEKAWVERIEARYPGV